MFRTMFICSMRPICLYIIHQKEDLIGCCWFLTDGQTTLKNRASLSWEVGVEDSKHKDFPQDRAHKEANQPTNVRRSVRLSLHMRPTVLAKIDPSKDAQNFFFDSSNYRPEHSFQNIYDMLYAKWTVRRGKLILSKKHLKTPKIMDNFSDWLTLEDAEGQTDHTRFTFRPPPEKFGV